MIYAISDIHGEYEKYKAMMKKIHFSEDDTLFILGDVVDRGPEPIKILQDIAVRKNVYLIKGNHEATASYILHKLNTEITEENAENQIDAALMRAIMDWQQDGGSVTMKAFRKLSFEERVDILDFIDDAPLYDVADVANRTFVLVHAGLGNFEKNKRMKDYSFEELAYMRPNYEKQYFKDDSIFIVSGHVPTMSVTGKNEIYQSHNNILIDCGATFGGNLACLCLDSLDVFYT